MANSKLFTAQEAAKTVLDAVRELTGAHLAKSAEDHKVKEQPAPNKNPAEIKENGNPAPGAFPQNSEKYGAELKGHKKLSDFVKKIQDKRIK